MKLSFGFAHGRPEFVGVSPAAAMLAGKALAPAVQRAPARAS